MAKEQNTAGYGYSEGSSSGEANIHFGLNTGDITLTKFEWTPNGGKDGAELEALDIVFKVEDREISHRQFPINRAYYKPEGSDTQEETTDPAHPAFKQAQADLSAILVHIIGCFVEKDDIKAALQTPISSFKEYCKILKGLLPKNYQEEKLDLFFAWEWSIKGDNDRTYLRLPKNMKHGRWVGKAVEPVGGEWEKQQKPNADLNETALRYIDTEGNVHPFTRNGWFMESNFASIQKEEASTSTASRGVSEGSDGGW